MSDQKETQVALVTGGSRGIGEAIVRRLAADGFHVVFTYNSSSAAAEKICADLQEAGQKAEAVKADIADAGEVQNLIDETIKRGGRLDVLVNNAGITRDTLLMRMSEDDWNAVLDTNLKGAFLTSKAVCRQMMRQRSGRIINIGSIVGLGGNAGQVNYSASKAGLVGLTKSLAKELASRNILVNCVAPGYVKTDMTGKLTDDQVNAFLDSIPLRRGAEGAEIAGAVSFLASGDSAYITGQVLNVDGGLAM